MYYRTLDLSLPCIHINYYPYNNIILCLSTRVYRFCEHFLEQFNLMLATESTYGKGFEDRNAVIANCSNTRDFVQLRPIASYGY